MAYYNCCRAIIHTQSTFTYPVRRECIVLSWGRLLTRHFAEGFRRPHRRVKAMGSCATLHESTVCVIRGTFSFGFGPLTVDSGRHNRSEFLRLSGRPRASEAGTMDAMAVHASAARVPLRFSSHRPESASCRGLTHEELLRMSWKMSAPCGLQGIRGCRGVKRMLLQRGTFELRSTASDNDSVALKNSIEQVEKLRASAIKAELTELGVSFADCFEKSELVFRLARARLIQKKSKRSVKTKSYKPLFQLPITRLRHTLNSPKNYILIPLTINNQGPFNFLLDTGSTVTLVQPSIAIDRLRLPVTPARQSLALLGGGISDPRVMTVNFAEVLLGNYPMKNISALLMDQNMLQGWDPSIAGLLGLNILSQFDVEFDFKREHLVFHLPGAAGRGEFDVHRMEKLATSDITLGILGVKVALGRARPEVALFDLGSALCVATPDIARSAGVPETVIRSKNPSFGGGGIGQQASMQFSSANLDIRMVTAKGDSDKAVNEDFTVRQVQFAIGDIPALRAVGCRILLGINLFRNTSMIFSQSTKSVYLEEPTA